MALFTQAGFYLIVLAISIGLSVAGWHIGAKLKHNKTEARHQKDLAVVQEFEKVD